MTQTDSNEMNIHELKAHLSDSDPLDLLNFLDFETWSELEDTRILNDTDSSVIIDDDYFSEIGRFERQALVDALASTSRPRKKHTSYTAIAIATCAICLIFLGLLAGGYDFAPIAGKPASLLDTITASGNR